MGLNGLFLCDFVVSGSLNSENRYVPSQRRIGRNRVERSRNVFVAGDIDVVESNTRDG